MAYPRRKVTAASHSRRPRDPSDIVGTSEQNEHAIFEVYAAPIYACDAYFRAVRRELEVALGEGVILIERQLVTLI